MNIPGDALLDAAIHAFAVEQEINADLVRQAGGASCVAVLSIRREE